MGRFYPRLGQLRQAERYKFLGAGKCAKCDAAIPVKAKFIWVDIQVDWMRGNDVCVALCLACGKKTPTLEEALELAKKEGGK